MDERRTDKAEVISYVMAHTPISPSEAVMVGDRIYDIEGGKRMGIDTVGVLFGYGSREELAGATHLIHTPSELLQL